MSKDNVAIQGPYAIIVGAPAPIQGVLVVGGAEVSETFEGNITLSGNLLLRVKDVDTAANLVRLAQDALVVKL